MSIAKNNRDPGERSPEEGRGKVEAVEVNCNGEQWGESMAKAVESCSWWAGPVGGASSPSLMAVK